MTRIALVTAALIMAVLPAVGQPEVQTLYVAPDGNDAWSGRLDKPNVDGTDGPLATITAARDAVRDLKGADPGRPVTVLIRGGVYLMDEPFVLTPLDSGSADAPVTYAAYPGEKPVLSGGRAITDWQEGADGVWSATVPADEGWYFRQLFVNGKRRIRARTPNEGYFFTAGKVGDGNNTAFRYAAGDIQPWDDLADINAVVFHSWETSLLPIQEIDDQ